MTTFKMLQRYKAFLIIILGSFIGFNLWHISKHGLWDPPSFIHSLTLNSQTAAIFSKIDPAIVSDGLGGNDGQFFYILSYDPLLLTQKYTGFLDFPRYRHNRVVYPLLAHIAALGQPKWYPYTLMFLGWLAYILGGGIVYQLCKKEQWTLWVLAGYLTNTGIVYSLFRDMSEPLATTFILFGFLLWLLNRRRWAIVYFAMAVLTKEIYLIPPLAIYLWDWQQGNLKIKKAIQAGVFTLLPYILWVSYVAMRTPYDNPFATLAMAGPSFGIGRFSLPFVGMSQEMFWGLYHATTRTVFKLTLSTYIVTTTCTLLGFIAFWYRPTLWTALLVCEGLFLTSVRGEIWNYYASSCRQSSFLYVLVYFWIADELKFIKNRPH